MDPSWRRSDNQYHLDLGKFLGRLTASTKKGSLNAGPWSAEVMGRSVDGFLYLLAKIQVFETLELAQKWVEDELFVMVGDLLSPLHLIKSGRIKVERAKNAPLPNWRNVI